MDTRQLIELSLGESLQSVFEIPGHDPIFGAQELNLDPQISQRVDFQLYQHQCLAIQAALQGEHVLVSTGTGSGKSLCFHLPVIEACLREPHCHALYIYPTKALAHDQLGTLQNLMPDTVFAGTYDGDTSKNAKAVTKKLAHIIITNPDMLHLSILPNHGSWSKFFRSLRYIVIDEIHAYRGVFGAHMSGILRRLLRICTLHKSHPQILAGSATLAHPQEFFEKLTGKSATCVDSDSSNKGRQSVFLASKDQGSRDNPSQLIANLVAQNRRVLTFCRSRMATEILLKQTRDSLNLVNQGNLVDSYRAGYKPTERRKIERAFQSGKLKGLITTNAMELGVDFKGIDVVVLHGFPGTISSFWQQVGRTGRGGEDGAAVYFAGANPMDQFLMQNPEFLFSNQLDPVPLSLDNPKILESQILCACHEIPLDSKDACIFGAQAQICANQLVEERRLALSDSNYYYRGFDNPAKNVNIRKISSDSIRLLVDGEELEVLDFQRALMTAYPGAVVLQRGQAYLVTDLNLQSKIANLQPTDEQILTFPVMRSWVEPLVNLRSSGPVNYCACQVTSKVTAFTMWSNGLQISPEEFELDLPATTYGTTAVHLELSEGFAENPGIPHAVEHSLRMVAPIICGCDPSDLGSWWLVSSDPKQGARVMLFDAFEGGLGYSQILFDRFIQLVESALNLLKSCSCVKGCPRCLFLLQCEEGNETLDKSGAIKVLDQLQL